MTKRAGGMRGWLAAGVCAGAIVGAPVSAETASYRFNIPSEDIGAALRAYAAATGTQVLFDSQVVHGLVSAPLSGAYTSETGLNRLLAGSHLAWHRTEAGVVLISAQPQAPAVPRPRPRAVPDSGPVEVTVKGIVRQRPADNTPPPLDVYAALPKYERMTLSPDGNGIAFLTSYEGAHYLVTYDLATKTKRAVKLSPGAIASIDWADADHVLVTAARTGLRGTCAASPADGGHSNISVQSIMPSSSRGAIAFGSGSGPTMSAPVATSSPPMGLLDSLRLSGCVYFGVRAQSVVTLIDMAASTGADLGNHLSENANLPLGTPEVRLVKGKTELVGPFLELRTQNVIGQATERVYSWCVDPQTARGRIIDDGGGDPDRESVYPDDWLLDREARPVARAVYDYDRQKFTVEMRTGGGWKPVLTRDIEHRTHTVAPYLAGLGRGEDTILIVDTPPGGSDRAGPRTFHYYELSADGKRTGPLEPDDASQDRPVFDPASGRLAGFVAIGERETYSLSDAALQLLYQRAQAAVPGETVRIVATARDPRRMIIHAEGGEDPGSYYLIDFAKGSSTPIGEDYALLPNAWVASQSPISYKAADGLEIEALLTLPPKPEAKNLPLIVLPHDGPGGHERLGFDWLAQALASRGYLVLQPDYRGSDGHGPAFTAAGYGQWGRAMQSDLTDGVRELAAEGMADPRRVCIIGFGYGGYAALMGASESSTYRCAVSINGISDLAAYKTWQEGQGATPEQDAITPLIPDPDWPRAFKVNPDSPQVLQAFLGRDAPSPKAASVAMPVLLIHESDDPVVPAGQSQTMRDALRDIGRPAEWLEIKGKDHTAATEDERAAILQAVGAFLARHNPAG